MELSKFEGRVIEFVEKNVVVTHYKKGNVIAVSHVEENGKYSTGFPSSLKDGVPETGTLEEAKQWAQVLQPQFAAWAEKEKVRQDRFDRSEHTGPSFGTGGMV